MAVTSWVWEHQVGCGPGGKVRANLEERGVPVQCPLIVVLSFSASGKTDSGVGRKIRTFFPLPGIQELK